MNFEQCYELLINITDTWDSLEKQYRSLYKDYQKLTLDHDLGKDVSYVGEKLQSKYVYCRSLKKEISMKWKILEGHWHSFVDDILLRKQYEQCLRIRKRALFFKNWLKKAARTNDQRCFGLNLYM